MSEERDMDRDEHAERWNDEVAAFALDALDGAELEDFTAHMADCPICAERLRWLAPAIDVLPTTVAVQEPPAALKSRLMDVVNREAEMIEASEAPDRAVSGPGRASHSSGSSHSRSSRFSGFSLRPALAGLGVALVLAAGVAGYAIHDSGSGGSSAVTYEAKADDPGSHATGTLEVDGDAGMLHVANLPATRSGEVYQAWVQDRSGADGGAVHPSSVFVVADGGVGDVAIPHGLSNAEKVMVTREPKGGSELPSENPVLTAEIG